MSEILLQTLVEKVTAIDKRSKDTQEMIQRLPDYSKQIDQANKRFDVLQAEVKGIPAQISIPEEDILDLKEQLRQNTAQLKKPLEQVIRHVHHLHWPLTTCFVMGGIIFFLVVFLTLAWDKIHDHRAADIKYRDLRLWGNRPLQRILDEADSEYVADPQGMEKSVNQEELSRQAEKENQQRYEEKQKEIGEKQEREKAGDGQGASNRRLR